MQIQIALYEKDQTLLAKNLTYRKDLEIKPTQSQNKIIDANLLTKFIAVLAAYRHLDKAPWKSFISINPEDIEQLTIELNSFD